MLPGSSQYVNCSLDTRPSREGVEKKYSLITPLRHAIARRGDILSFLIKYVSLKGLELSRLFDATVAGLESRI